MHASMTGPSPQSVPGAAFSLTRYQSTVQLMAVGWCSATPARRATKHENV